MGVRIINADVFDGLAQLPDESVSCVVTSPPYFGLRDYGTGAWEGGDPNCDHRPQRGLQGSNGQRADRSFTGSKPHHGACGRCGAIRIDRQIGLEPTIQEHIETLVRVFREVRRVLRKDGTLWLNYGDAYCGGGGFSANSPSTKTSKSGQYGLLGALKSGGAKPQGSIKPKDLMMMPARLAIALQEDGWWIRSDIIWHKLNPMPESCQDRPTSAHEHIFLLTKSPRYFYDADAVREVSITGDMRRPYGSQGAWEMDGRPSEQRHGGKLRSIGAKGNANGFRGGSYVNGEPGPRTAVGNVENETASRNIRNVWPMATAPFPAAHFATFPPELVDHCIKAGCPAGGTVLDPFGGSGTTSLVADRLGRNAILIELNAEYCRMAEARIAKDAGLFADVGTTQPVGSEPEQVSFLQLF